MRKKYLVLLVGSYPIIWEINKPTFPDYSNSILLDHNKINDSDLARHLLDIMYRMLFNSHLI